MDERELNELSHAWASGVAHELARGSVWRERVLKHFETYPTANRSQIASGRWGGVREINQALEDLIAEGRVTVIAGERSRVYALSEDAEWLRQRPRKKHPLRALSAEHDRREAERAGW